jgi:hypothetical protein
VRGGLHAWTGASLLFIRLVLMGTPPQLVACLARSSLLHANTNNFPFKVLHRSHRSSGVTSCDNNTPSFLTYCVHNSNLCTLCCLWCSSEDAVLVVLSAARRCLDPSAHPTLALL